MASKSDYAENKILEHLLGVASLAHTSPVYLALLTVVPTDASTGATITEASYTGYARKSFNATEMGAAAGGSITNSDAAIVFAACTAGSSTIIGFAILDSATIGAGNIHYWGTVASKLIDTSNTPPTVNVNGLVVTED